MVVICWPENSGMKELNHPYPPQRRTRVQPAWVICQRGGHVGGRDVTCVSCVLCGTAKTECVAVAVAVAGCSKGIREGEKKKKSSSRRCESDILCCCFSLYHRRPVLPTSRQDSPPIIWSVRPSHPSGNQEPQPASNSQTKKKKEQENVQTYRCPASLPPSRTSAPPVNKKTS